MATIQQITIPEPCTQQWNQMTPKSTGRHCQSCDKTVVDFTLMTSQEIIGYLGKSGNVCGRISALQFDGINKQLAYSNTKDRSDWRKWFMAAAIMASTVFNKALAQPAAVPKIEQGPVNGFTLGKIAMPEHIEKVFEGQVVDDQNSPIPGVKVVVKGTNVVGITDVNGKFRISGPAQNKVLVFSFVGFETTEKKVKDQYGKPIMIKLKLTPMMLGGMGVIYSKPSLMKQLYSRLVTKHKGKFFS